MHAPYGAAATRGPSFWRSPRAWLREHQLGRGYWIFFIAAFFFDAGFSVYFFLFNLYLLDFRFDDRAIGFVNGAFTLGAMAGTIPVGILGRRIGMRPLLLACFLAAPAVGMLRAVWMWVPAQVTLAFIAGMAMCLWTVSFLPVVAALTTEDNRTAGMSMIFSVGVGTSALGGIVCGYLPDWLRYAGFSLTAASVKRLILIASCLVAAAGIAAILRLPLRKGSSAEASPAGSPRENWLALFRMRPFLRRFLFCMALWSALIAAFAPFANVYLSRDLHVSLASIGLIFSFAQGAQVLAGLLLPVIIRRAGMLNGILATELAAASLLLLIAGPHNRELAIVLYLAFSAAQWMSSPALYNLLMNETPEPERSTAAGFTMFVNALAASAATTLAGMLYVRFGYPAVLVGVSTFAVAAAVSTRILLSRRPAAAPSAPPPGAVPDSGVAAEHARHGGSDSRARACDARSCP
ncbi:MAG TPA: MFS transporter [Acidobacteriaceae bacterium]|nr:MFS transporter [Acidobacteriaceae bacterium]